MKIKTEILDVTPDMAARWLRANPENRKITESRTNRMAAAMERGEWMFNGEAIKFDDAGNLRDGQHRLTAIVKSTTTQRMLVVSGLDPVAQDTMDTGRARGLGDVLTIHGETNATMMAAVLRMIYAYDKIAIPHALALTPSDRPTNTQLMKMLDERPSIRGSVAYSAHHRVTLLSTSAVAGLHYLFTHVDPEDATVFFDGLSSGPWERGTAIYALRERFIEALKNPSAMTDVMRTHLTIRAFNRWRAGGFIDRLNFGRTGATRTASYPTIDGIKWA